MATQDSQERIARKRLAGQDSQEDSKDRPELTARIGRLIYDNRDGQANQAIKKRITAYRFKVFFIYLKSRL
jgi:hypothetical protein